MMKDMMKLMQKNKEYLLVALVAVLVLVFRAELMNLLRKGEDVVEDTVSAVSSTVGSAVGAAGSAVGSAVDAAGSAVCEVGSAVSSVVPKVSLCNGQKMPEKKEAPKEADSEDKDVTGFDGTWGDASAL